MSFTSWRLEVPYEPAPLKVPDCVLVEDSGTRSTRIVLLDDERRRQLGGYQFVSVRNGHRLLSDGWLQSRHHRGDRPALHGGIASSAGVPLNITRGAAGAALGPRNRAGHFNHNGERGHGA